MLEDHQLGAFDLQCGLRTCGLRLRYEQHGQLNAERSNAILFPTWFAGRHTANRWIIGSGRALDTRRFCIIVVNALGNGESSSPSNDAQLLLDAQPVAISLFDNVRAQQELVRALGIERLHAVVGRSMGAQQALQWGCLYPQRVNRIFAFCGLPRTTPHNRLLLEAMAQALSAQEDAHGAAVALAARIYAAWSLSHEFFAGTMADPSCRSAGEWVDRHLVAAFQAFHRLDLLTLVRTWQSADISDNPVFNGKLHAALAAIQAPALLMPISHDLIFPPQDFEEAQAHIPRAESHLLYSHWGHRAAAPGGSAEDIATLERTLDRFLGKGKASAMESLSLRLGQVWPF
ncbi:alpha/beta fold hydrolase [Ramlibacter sp. 2FC]|uniref:alpha/beta fold hydrolase n=1 Tax=Ramlibacter sp. 2FC TaxID=2502188 RepID=UPI0014857D55|nr:alpha/beta fold hydrolase [Ramlibacter sp. 2FC]